MSWTMSRVPTTAGEDAISESKFRRQRNFPEPTEMAITRPCLLVMYAVPSETTEGNSISPPIRRIHTCLKGGRIRMCCCACVLRATAPYIGHCSLGLYMNRVRQYGPRWNVFRCVVVV